MAIQEISDSDVVQRCARCASENVIAIGSISVGVDQGGDQVDAGIIRLPECPTCQSREYLVRTPANVVEYPEPLNSPAHLHRLLVDELHAVLVKKRCVASRLLTGIEAVHTRPIAPETRELVFKHGLKLSASDIENLHGSRPIAGKT